MGTVNGWCAGGRGVGEMSVQSIGVLYEDMGKNFLTEGAVTT